MNSYSIDDLDSILASFECPPPTIYPQSLIYDTPSPAPGSLFDILLSEQSHPSIEQFMASSFDLGAQGDNALFNSIMMDSPQMMFENSPGQVPSDLSLSLMSANKLLAQRLDSLNDLQLERRHSIQYPSPPFDFNQDMSSCNMILPTISHSPAPLCDFDKSISNFKSRGSPNPKFAFGCQVQGCTKTFRTEQELQTHCEKQHDPARKFGCPHCAVRFERKGDLDRHIKSSHRSSICGPSDSIEYPCHVCQKKFGRFDALKRHFKTKKHLKLLSKPF